MIEIVTKQGWQWLESQLGSSAFSIPDGQHQQIADI